MARLLAKHPLSIRILHWMNFPTLAIMVWSGLLIYWAYDPYQITVGGVVLFKFFPDWFYRTFDLAQGLATGMAYHFTFGWLFALTGLAYVISTLITGEWRELVPNRRTPRDAWDTVLHDLKIRKAPLPAAKFNGAQRLAYTGVVGMGALSIVTGLAILKPTQLWWLTAALGGYQTARLIHFTLTILYVLFFVTHVAQVAKAGWNNFRSMVTGYEVAPAGEGTLDARPTAGPKPVG